MAFKPGNVSKKVALKLSEINLKLSGYIEIFINDASSRLTVRKFLSADNFQDLSNTPTTFQTDWR